MLFRSGLTLVVGGAIAAVTLVTMVRGTTGEGTPYLPTLGWVAVLLATVVLGTVASLVPARWLLRTDPIEAVGARE